MSSKNKQGSDERFLRVQKDPRFWEMLIVYIMIKRFQSMFHDERSKVKYTVDKRGRPINHTSTDDLKRFYKLSDSEEEEEEETEGKKKKKQKKKGMEVKAERDVKTGGGKTNAEPGRGVRAVEYEDDEDDEEQQSRRRTMLNLEMMSQTAARKKNIENKT
ncbi:ESF1 homolog isoform X1 [Lates japonicus]|uniref:ESF1 homolog isoform X1 n=1 Tax=Lates japonicus TaxID=270547 RepID=A0AAD3RGE0_LATJO|nr:ESF1 homolog isoform X1 [Lates japonicus]